MKTLAVTAQQLEISSGLFSHIGMFSSVPGAWLKISIPVCCSCVAVPKHILQPVVPDCRWAGVKLEHRLRKNIDFSGVGWGGFRHVSL